jgi:hypothetical protein
VSKQTPDNIVGDLDIKRRLISKYNLEKYEV